MWHGAVCDVLLPPRAGKKHRGQSGDSGESDNDHSGGSGDSDSDHSGDSGALD